MNLSAIFLTTVGKNCDGLLCPNPDCPSLLLPKVITYPPSIMKAE